MGGVPAKDASVASESEDPVPEEVEHEEEECEDDESLPEAPAPGRVLLRGAFVGSVITCDNCLDASVSLDYDISITELQPALEAFFKAAEAMEEIQEMKENSEEAESDAKKRGLPSSETWHKLLSVLALDSLEFHSCTEKDAESENKYVRLYKAKLEESKIDCEVLRKSAQDLEQERNSLQAENQALQQDLARMSSELDQRSNFVQKPQTLVASLPNDAGTQELHTQVADLQTNANLLQKTCASVSTSGNLAMDGAFVGKLQTEAHALDVSLPVRGDIPLHLVLETVRCLKISATLQEEQQKISELEKEAKEQRRKEQMEEKAASLIENGSPDEDAECDEQEEEEEEEEDEGESEDYRTTSETWSQLLSLLSKDTGGGGGLAESTGAATVVAGAVQQNVEQQGMQSRMREMQELKRINEVNRKMWESLEASEVEVRNLRREVEQKLQTNRAQLADASATELPTLMTSAVQYDAITQRQPASKNMVSSLPASARTTSSYSNDFPVRAHSGMDAPVKLKLASELSSHVQDLEKWAKELNAFSNRQP